MGSWGWNQAADIFPGNPFMRKGSRDENQKPDSGLESRGRAQAAGSSAGFVRHRCSVLGTPSRGTHAAWHARVVWITLTVNNVQDVAVRILEPRDLPTTGDVNVALPLHPWQVVMLEGDALCLEGPHDAFQIVAHYAGHGRSLFGASILGAIGCTWLSLRKSNPRMSTSPAARRT